MKTCEHPREEFIDQGAGVSNHCPQCRDRVCIFCRRVAPESWMSGQCHGCYRINERASRKREADWAEERRLRSLAEAWEEGRGTKPDSANPYSARLEAMP